MQRFLTIALGLNTGVKNLHAMGSLECQDIKVRFKWIGRIREAFGRVFTNSNF